MPSHLTFHESAVLDAADAIRRELLDCRKSLPPCANWRAPVPTDPTARRLHDHLLDGSLASLMPLVALLHNNAALKMPLAELLRPVRVLERYVESWAVQRQEPERPLVIPVRRETRAQSVLDMAELELVRDERDPAVLQQSITAGLAQIAATEDLVLDCERRLVKLGGRVS